MVEHLHYFPHFDLFQLLHSRRNFRIHCIKTNQNGEEVRDLKGSSAKEKVEPREKVLSEKMRSCAMF